MTVRPADPDDIDAVKRVAERSWTADYPDILSRETAEAAAEEWYGADSLAAELDAERTLLSVVEADDRVVGFAHATWNDDEGYILRLYVHPDHRGAGHGRELLAATRTALADRGVDRVSAMVLAANDGGNEFYERFGFERADESETVIDGESYRENRYVLDV